jgi:hypothetical protein
MRLTHSFRALLLAFALTASPAWAESDAGKTDARRLFHDAGTAMGAGDYATAALLYAHSNELYPAPTAALGEARALVKLGRLLDAHERYRRLAATDLDDDAPEAFVEAVEAADGERELVRDRLATLIVVVEGEAEVFLDGAALARSAWGEERLVDPGKHHVRAVVEGGRSVEREVHVVEGQVLEVPILVAAAALDDPPEVRVEPASDGSAQRVAGYLMIGVGGAALAAFGITGALYLDAKSTIDAECDAAKRCSQAGLDAVDRGDTLGSVNAAMLIGGLVSATAGVVLVLTAADAQVAIAPALSPTSAFLGARWRF